MSKTFDTEAVVQQTGVKANTLRAWERRYQLPMPRRTEGGHRRYSDRDIEILRWLLARKGGGLSISRAVALWRELIASGADPLRDNRVAASDAARDRAGEPNAPVAAADAFRARWVRACLDFDEETSQAVLREASGVLDTETIALDILREGLVEIGDLWYHGRATAQQEHFVSGLAMKKLAALTAASPPTERRPSIVVATPSNEEHVIPSMILTLLLRIKGKRVVYLGANVPQIGMRSMINIIRPDLVVLSSTHLGSLLSLQELTYYLREAGIMVAFGGRIFQLYASLRQPIPGYYLGGGLHDSIEDIEKLLNEHLKLPSPLPFDQKSEVSLKTYRQHKPSIQHEVDEALEYHSEMELFHTFVANNLEAHLGLGMDEPLWGELDWLFGLVSNNETNFPPVTDYMDLYHRASTNRLAMKGEPVLHWLGAAKNYVQTRNEERKA